MIYQKASGKLTNAIIIIAVIIIVAAVLLSTASQQGALSKITAKYQKNYPYSVLTIQKFAGEDSEAITEKIKEYCPGFSLESYYLASISNSQTGQSELYVINPDNGNAVCLIDQSTSINTSQAGLEQDLLATINNEPVYMQEVLTIYQNIPSDQRTNQSLQQSLDQVINTKLLLQDAQQKGLDVSSQEIEDAINTLLTNNGITLKELQSTLASAGSSLQALQEQTRKELLLQKEINLITSSLEPPTESELKDYYEQNQEQSYTLASAKIRQIMIYANTSNQEEKLELIKAVRSEYDGTNFCELVEKYSEDLVSIPRCGLYAFQQGQLLTEFEEVVFSMEPGSAFITQTRLGYHFVELINKTEPRQVTFEESRDSIYSLLVLEQKQAVLNNYIQSLREEAEIISYID